MAGVCKLCGTPHADGAKFCTECGAVLIARVGEPEVKAENVVEQPTVETVENTTTPENTVTEPVTETQGTGVSNTYGAENAEVPTAYPNPYGGGNYNAPNGGNPYGGGNYNAPNGGNPYGGGNYNAPNGGNPYGGGNYNAPNGGNPYGGGNYNAPNGGNPYGGGNYNAPNGTNPYGVPYNPNANQMQPPKKMNIGLLVFSIINMLLGCCSCTGFIFGGAGLAFVMMAKNAKTDMDEANYNRISMILNIIGVVLTVLVCIAAFALGITEGFETEF